MKVTQSCPTLCDCMDYIVHGILQVKILEWVAFPFSRGSSQSRDQTQVSHTAGGFFRDYWWWNRLRSNPWQIFILKWNPFWNIHNITRLNLQQRMCLKHKNHPYKQNFISAFLGTKWVIWYNIHLSYLSLKVFVYIDQY